MKNTQSAVSALFAVVSYEFDNGDKRFTIDHGQIAQLLAGDEFESMNPELLANLILIALKDLVHRSSWAKGISDKGADETERLLAVIEGAAQSGRFKITDADRDAAKRAMKQYEMAPEPLKAQYLANNGMEYIHDFDTLAKRYMDRRAREAAEKKNLV